MADDIEARLREVAGYTKVPLSETHRRALIKAADERSEAATLRARVKELEEGLRPFATAANAFLFAIGPDGVDDGLTVIASVACRPEREATLGTADFSHAAALLTAQEQH